MLTDRVADVVGSAEERGFIQGTTFAEALPAGWESLLQLGAGPTWVPHAVHRAAIRVLLWGLGKFYLHRHRQLLEQRAGGRHLRYLRGLARGLNLPASVPYGFNALEIESCHVGFAMGCSSLAFGNASTTSGTPRLAYNHDFPPSFGPLLCVRRSTPRTESGSAGGYRSLAVTYPVLVGAMVGVNECGLALSVNQAFATDVSRLRAALYLTMLVQECLDECADVEAAVEQIVRTPVTNGALITLVDEAGNRAVVELSGTAAKVRRPDRTGVLWSCNKYRLADMCEYEVPVGAVTTGLFPGYDIHESNLSRHRRLQALLSDDQRYSDADIQRIMADHDDGEGNTNTICRHGDPLNETIMTVIIDPSARAMKLLVGKPCEQTFQRVGLFERTPNGSAEPVGPRPGAYPRSTVAGPVQGRAKEVVVPAPPCR